MKLLRVVVTMMWLSLLAFGGEKFIHTKMGDVKIQKVHDYEHWLVFNGKRIQKFEERYVTFQDQYAGSTKTIIILNIDTGTAMVKPEYAIIEIANGNIHLSNRIISYDYTFKVLKATSKKIVMDVGLSTEGAKRTAIYQDGKITEVENKPTFNSNTSVADIEAQKKAILANLNSLFQSESRIEGGMDIPADDGNMIVYKKDNFTLRYAELTLFSHP